MIESKSLIEGKNLMIIALCFVVIVLLGFVSVSLFKDYRVGVYNKGVQDGALLQQQGILRAIQTTGYVTLNMGVNEQGQPVSLILAPVRQQQAQ